MTAKTMDEVEVVLSVIGDREPKGRGVGLAATVAELLAGVRADLGRDDLIAVFVEDVEIPLEGGRKVLEIVDITTVVLHVSDRHTLDLEVIYNGAVKKRTFAPSATVRKATAWAISPEAFNLTGTASDFQLKLGDEVLAPEIHLGQIAHGPGPVKLHLVFKIKPQG